MPAQRLRSLAFAVMVVLATVVSLTSCQEVKNGRYVQRVFAEYEQVATAETYRTAIDFDLQANIELKLDIWQPKGDTTNGSRPVQLWMHGGAWTKGVGTRTSIQGYAQDAALRGYVGVSIDYRLRTSAQLPGASLDAYDDAVAAVQWLKGNAARFRIDPKAIIAAGYSAGAINAMNLLYTPYERPAGPSPVLGAFAVAGRPMGLPAADRPPAVYFSATDDTTVPYSSVKSSCDSIVAAGNICELVTYASGGHGIGYSQREDIENRSAQFAMDKILPRADYFVS